MKWISLILLFLPLFANGQKYSLEDLIILENENNFVEFLDHALDIRPSQRDEKWKAMTSKMAEKYITYHINKNIYNSKILNRLNKISQWPVLRADVFFQTKKTEYTLGLLQQCYVKIKDTNECTKQAKKYWKDAIKSPEIAESFASIINKNNQNTDLWDFYKYIVKSNVAKFYCSKEITKTVLLKNLKSQLIKLSDDIKFRNYISENIHKNCIDESTSWFKNLFLKGNSTEKHVSFLVLKEFSKISNKELNFMLTHYLLSNPPKGDLLNQAWNKLTDLKDNYKTRNEVFNIIKHMDPLPDLSFASNNRDKRETLLKYVNKVFPEYINHYTHTCKNFVTGKKKFPNGNPTINCRIFLKSALELKIIDQEFLLMFPKEYL